MHFIKEKLRSFFHPSHLTLYVGLTLGFVIKSIGAAWDVSYHFKHFREFYQLPHIINAFGDLVGIVLLAYLWFLGPKQIRPQLKIILYGILVFIVGVGFDQWSHEAFGIDLTIWSPSHFVLYTGTFISLLGAFLYVLHDYQNSHRSLQRVKKIFCIVFSYLILDSMWFVLLQHEQGVLMDYALKHGIRLADQDLLDLFFRTQHSVYSGLPVWLYGAWAVFSMVLVFQFVKRMNLYKYAATFVACLYLIQRMLMNIVFYLVNYPLSALPFYLVLIAFIFDLLYNRLEKKSLPRGIITSITPVVGIIVLSLFNPEPPIHPPIPALETLLFAIPAMILGYLLGTWLYHSFAKQHILGASR